jgi:hypothetical protein
VSDKAWKLLSAAEKEDRPDAPLLKALGLISEMNSDHAGDERYYRSALKIDANDLISSINLGPLLAKSGDIVAAANFWKHSFQINEDVPNLG